MSFSDYIDDVERCPFSASLSCRTNPQDKGPAAAAIEELKKDCLNKVVLRLKKMANDNDRTPIDLGSHLSFHLEGFDVDLEEKRSLVLKEVMEIHRTNEKGEYVGICSRFLFDEYGSSVMITIDPERLIFIETPPGFLLLPQSTA